MTPAAKSVQYFGYYLLILSVVLTIFPNVLLSTFQIPETNEVWIRVVGILVFNLGLFNVLMSPTNSTLYFTITVYTRTLVFFWFVVFVVAGWVVPQLILFGVVDLAGAAWTFFALRKS